MHEHIETPSNLDAFLRRIFVVSRIWPDFFRFLRRDEHNFIRFRSERERKKKQEQQ